MTKKHVSLKSAAEDNACDDIKKSTPTFLCNPRVMVVEKGFNGRPLDLATVERYKEVWKQAKADKTGDPFPPMRVQMVKGVPTVRDGHHRHQMYMELIEEGEPIERVRCEEFKGTAQQAILFMLGANDGLGWTMPQLGHKYAELVNLYGMTYAEVAKARGRSAQHVKDCIKLTEQDETVTAAIDAGTIAPAAALKLVKSQGAAEATRIIKQATNDIKAGVKAPKGGKITQKVIDNLARSKVDEASVRAKQTKDHLLSMLESPTFTREVKDSIRKVMKAIGGRIPESVRDAAAIDHVGDYLTEMSCNSNDIVKEAAKTLTNYRAGKFIPSNASPEAQFYGHMSWLSAMASTNTKPAMRAGAHWFMALIDANRSDRPVAPPPSVLSLDAAIQTEIDSGGAALAEDMCPEHAGLVGYLRRGV